MRFWVLSTQKQELENQAKLCFFCQVSNTRFYPTRRSVWQWILLGQKLENFPARGRFSKKCKKFWKIFQVLQLQAAVTPQWLLIDRNLLPKWPSTGCVIFIFTAGINWKSFPLPVYSTLDTCPKFAGTTDAISWRASCYIQLPTNCILCIFFQFVSIKLRIITLHRSTMYVDVAYCYRPNSVVCQSVGLSH